MGRDTGRPVGVADERALAGQPARSIDDRVSGPVGSIVIPAYNEANVVGRTLTSLFAGIDPKALEVVVACNGCTDATAAVAAEVHGTVTVLDLPPVGKAAAIRAAEREARALPRLYLDADVTLDGRSAVAVLTALRDGAVAARPPLRYDTTGASWLVKRYYGQRMRLPGVQTDLCGAGVYGLSEKARDAIRGVSERDRRRSVRRPGRRAVRGDHRPVRPGVRQRAS